MIQDLSIERITKFGESLCLSKLGSLYPVWLELRGSYDP